jgi:hypothetical protein
MPKQKTTQTPDTASLFAAIAQNLADAQRHLDDINATLTALAIAGIYPSVPTERWKDDKYLYICFGSGANTHGLTLDAKGRIYIGSDQRAINDARFKIANTIRHKELSRVAQSLDAWIQEQQHEIQHLARQSSQYPRAKL